MADFTLNLTGTAQLDNSAVTEEIKTEFIVQYTQANVMDSFVEYAREIQAKSISFPRYSTLATAETALTEREDITSAAMSDTEVILTPVEYGNAVTTTKLVDLQTGGRAMRGAIRLVAINMAETLNVLATRALEASTNVVYGGSAGSKAALAAGDVMSGGVLDKVYNKLARASVPAHPLTGTYVAFLHEDQIFDLRSASAANSWTDVNKYNNELPVLQNEVGMYKGFRIVRNNHSLLEADAGAGSPATVDVYTASFLGFNGLGKAESAMPSIVMTGPFDKLGRFVNIGWYGVLQYKIIEPTAVYKALTSSSVGANA
jgi:N4-gp56 family major capsid protein